MAGVTKTWIVTSANPRESHAGLDGETVAMDEPFSNGLMFPCDPDAPTEETINCTCIMSIEGNLGAGAELPDIESAAAAVEKAYEKYARTLNDIQVSDVAGYAGLDYEELNGVLRADGLADARPFIQELAASLDETIAEAPALTGKYAAWRGTSEEFMAQLRPGAVITDKGFVSTSWARASADNFALINGGETVKVITPAGTHAMGVTEGTILGGEGEAEVLLGRGTSFLVSGGPGEWVLTVLPRT